MTALAAVAAAARVLLVGSAADFGDPYSHTAYVLGVVTASGVFVVVGRERRAR